jgi:hypothetical protein
MKLWFCLTLACGALLACYSVLLRPPFGMISRMSSARDHASIKVKKPHLTRLPNRWSQACNAIRRALHLSNLLSSTGR